MLIGIHDAERDHMPKKTFPNLALMKISAWHKAQGDKVEWYIKSSEYDKVYSSKVFDFTPENLCLPEHTIKGGTGYGIYKELPSEIDEMFPDYTIYPQCDYAIGFLTRGCVRNCEWCVVPKKEGMIRPYRTVEQIARPDTDKIVFMDNNVLACEFGIEQLEKLGGTEYQIDFNQGMDIRLVTDRVAKALARIKWIHYIRFSCDTEAQLPYFERAMELFKKHGVAKSRVFIYLLVRADTHEAERRVRRLCEIYKNFNLYAQAERNPTLGIIPTKQQLKFAQRYIYGRNYKTETWQGYCQKRGFEC